jgi:hypothetical protein
MSITSVGDSSSRFGGFSFWGNRSRISWGAVLAGAAVTVATSLLLSLLGAAFGAGSIGDLGAAPDQASVRGIAAGAGLWTMIDLALSMALGGYVAARLSGTHSHLDGELHGITMWAVAVLFGVLAFAQAIGGVIESGFATVAGSSAGQVAGQVVGSLSGATVPGTNQQAALDRLALSLGGSGDPTTMSHEQIGAEIRSLLGGGNLLTNGSLSDADRARLVSLVAAQYGITKDEAGQRVARMESDLKARIAESDQRVRVLADQVAQGTTAGARALFTALVLGLLGALIGAWLGTRHKRVLHPEETQARIVPAGGHQPFSLSVCDDTGHLVAEYLRGMSFPASKQDLLRFAHARNAGPAVLHTIEGLADRNYASANEALAAMDMVH